MLIALLALLGVDLIVVFLLVAFVLTRKRWVERRPGAFPGAVRVASGDIDGLRPKWRRGYGRWVRDVLVWTRAPFHLWNDLVPVDGLAEQRPAHPDEIKRLGDRPTVAVLTVGAATAEVAAHDDNSGRLVGPFDKVLGSTPGADAKPSGGRCTPAAGS